MKIRFRRYPDFIVFPLFINIHCRKEDIYDRIDISISFLLWDLNIKFTK